MTAVTAEFAYLQQLVFDRSAIVLADDKQYLIDARLMPIARLRGLGSSDDVIHVLRTTRDPALETQVIEAMTTNETLWFRDLNPFNALRRAIIPEILRRKATTQQLSIWSAASSSGQELYSISMLLQEDFPQMLNWKIDLLGTDLSSEMVDKARAGRYSTLEINRGLPASLLVRYFTKDGAAFQVNDRTRQGVRFMQMNLATLWPPLPKFDVIFLRNVLIYFDIPTKRRILEAAARAMTPDGYLILGAAETMMGVSDLWTSDTVEGAIIYRLKGRT